MQRKTQGGHDECRQFGVALLAIESMLNWKTASTIASSAEVHRTTLAVCSGEVAVLRHCWEPVQRGFGIAESHGSRRQSGSITSSGL